MRFILGSSSPRRRELVASLGIDFEVISPEVDEARLPGEPPLEYVARISRAKSDAIARHIAHEAAVLLSADTIVLAADTIGVQDGQAHPDGDILGKPADATEARAMLARLRDKPHTVCTHICLTRLNGAGVQQRIDRLTRTQVVMRAYTDAEIDAYIATGDPFDKAGGYAIQHDGFSPVARIDGCYHNVVGLPLCEVRRALATLGYPLATPPAPEGVCDCPVYQSRPVG